MTPTEGDPSLHEGGETNKVEESTNGGMFECTYCETSFLGPPQSNEKLQIYKDHLIGFHKINKEVNKMLHQVANEYRSENEKKKVLTSKDNQMTERKENSDKRTCSEVSTQTNQKDFYRNFMHQDWDCSIDWKNIPKLKPITNSKKVSMTMKENHPEQDKGTNDSLPVIEQAVSLNQEAFDKMGSDIKFPITDISRTRNLASPKKNLIYVSKKEESPNKSRELNINDWTRPIRSSVATTDKASQPISNKSVKLRWEEKDEKLKGKYTFDLIKEPAAKRQKIVVRFKQEDEVQKVKLEDTSPEKDLTASSVGSNGMIYPEGNLAYTSQILSTDDSSKIDSSGQSTSKIKIFTDTF